LTAVFSLMSGGTGVGAGWAYAGPVTVAADSTAIAASEIRIYRSPLHRAGTRPAN
jgi:hypothetical protein